MVGEQRLIRVLTGSSAPGIDLERIVHGLWNWLSQLQAVIDEQMPDIGELRDDSAIATQWRALQAAAREIIDERAVQWDGLQLAQSVAEYFDDKLMLLVFGKFNAGKSSLCNFLAERLAVHGWSSRHFQLERGRIVYTGLGFAEGATETTSSVQGVEIGDHLVLLDTPGLHSMTAENAGLTRRFTDCADAVLWLSSSTSPGQVQELDELARELQRHKPLLPVITRSDVFDEDEINGEICKILRNKTADNRALQERDVGERTYARLRQRGVNPMLLRPALSISVHMARNQDQDDEAGLRAAGFDRLFSGLEELAAPALAYKRRKPAEVLLHHLQEHVQAPLERRLLVELATLQNMLHAEHARLLACPADVGQAAWRSVMSLLPGWIDAQTRNDQQTSSRRDRVQAVCAQLSQALDSALQAELAKQLSPWQPTLIVQARVLECRMDKGLVSAQNLEGADWGEKLYFRLGEIVQQHLSVSELGRLIDPCCAAVDRLLNACLHLQMELQMRIKDLAEQARALQQPAPV
ncbi:hypothetical protein CDEN61S_00785 [Castellaniella denitrificans]|uniref:GTPase n=1 Tax=Castellaniella sp. TaxID=1955812 RepID=UPI003D0B2160